MPWDRSTAPRTLLEPTPGFYRVRLVRRGPWVAAEIRLQDNRYEVELCGLGVTWSGSPERLADEIGSYLEDGRAFEHPMLRVSLFGHTIPQHEHAYLTARRLWAIQHAPDDPYASAKAPIDIDTIPPPF